MGRTPVLGRSRSPAASAASGANGASRA